jgi:hypothetical protein
VSWAFKDKSNKTWDTYVNWDSYRNSEWFLNVVSLSDTGSQANPQVAAAPSASKQAKPSPKASSSKPTPKPSPSPQLRTRSGNLLKPLLVTPISLPDPEKDAAVTRIWNRVFSTTGEKMDANTVIGQYQTPINTVFDLPFVSAKKFSYSHESGWLNDDCIFFFLEHFHRWPGLPASYDNSLVSHSLDRIQL